MSTGTLLNDPKTSAGESGVPINNTQISVKIFSDWQELESLGAAWNSIVEGNEKLTIFSTLEWLGAWWKAYGKDKQLVAPVFLNSRNEVVGVIPLYVDVVKSALPRQVRRLRFVGDGSADSDNLDLIIRKGHEDSCTQAFLSWLETNSSWDICELNTFPLDSAALPSLVSELKNRKWTLRRLERPRSTISLPDTWESYLKQTISKNQRTQISYKSNRLCKRHRVSIVKCDDAQELPASLAALFELHQKRWQLRGGPGSFSCAKRRALYETMAASFLRRGWLEFWILQLEGKPVAMQYSFQYRNAVYLLQEGFDPDYSADSVGFVLRAHVLKALIGRGVRQYDFLGGRDPSKDRWGAQAGSYVDIHFAKPLTRGGLYLRMHQTTRVLKSWLRRILPTALLRVLREHQRNGSGI